MKDFLSNLVDRALNQAPTVQRRRPSIFEPVPGAASPGITGLHEPSLATDAEGWREVSMQHGTEPEGEAARPAHPSSAPRQPPRPPASAGAESVEFSPPFRQPTPRSTRSQVLPAETRAVLPAGEHPTVEPKVPAAERPSDRSWASLLPERVIERIIERQVVLPAASGRLAPTPERPAPSATPARREQEPAAQDADRTRPSRHPRDHAAAVSGAPTRPPAKPGSRPEPIKPARPAAKAPPPPPTTVRERAPAAPSVHVSIGRIEINAAGGPPAGREKPKAAPRLSLDDYLHARSGGRT